MLAAAAVMLAVGGTGLVAWWASWRATHIADPGDPRLVAEGAGLYGQHCASCHGKHLEGQPNWRERLPNGRLPAPPQDATGHTGHHPDRQLFEITKSGASGLVPGYESDMPAFKGTLSDREIWAVLSYIESTWPPEIRERQERTSRRAE